FSEQCDGCGQTRLASELTPIGDGSIKACEMCYTDATAMVLTKSANLDTFRLEHATRLHHELGATHPDGTLRRAPRVYRHTLRNFRTAVFRFNRSILDGTSYRMRA